MDSRSTDPDAVLLQAVAQGDERAFGELYRAHLPLIVGWIYNQTGDREVAADLAAEVFAAALISRGDTAPSGARRGSGCLV